VGARRIHARLQDEFLVAIGAFYFPVFQFQKNLRVTKSPTAAIAGYGDFFDFDDFGRFGRFGRLRHGVFASQKR
jgi:hypothetical protein